MTESRATPGKGMRRKTKAMVLGAAAVAALVVIGVVWLVLVSGPPIEVTMDERGTLVDTSRLGEYFTASSLVEVAACGPDQAPTRIRGCSGSTSTKRVPARWQ